MTDNIDMLLEQISAARIRPPQQQPSNRERIIRLSQRDPFIDRGLHFFHSGRLSWAEALEEIVIALHSGREGLLDELRKTREEQPLSFIVQSDFDGKPL